MNQKNRPIGLLSAVLKATHDGALAGLKKFSADEIAPKLAPYLSALPKGRQLSQSLWYAKKKGFLATQERTGTITVTLTYKGREHLLRLNRLNLKTKQPSGWDGKWRMITFDIPERRRYARDTLRLALKRLGFVKLEGSIWVTPYDHREALAAITESLLIKSQVRQYLVESFDEEEKVRERFGLPPNQQSSNNNQHG